jgi:DNA-binding transcriptional ArsR family regulator
MLLDLLFGSYRQRVLTQVLLHPDDTYHVRELARLTGTTAGTLHKELTRLAEAGLLSREKQGNQVRYRANRECSVYPVLADALRTMTPPPMLALIFGSLARGEENARSDVDLLVIAETAFADVVKALHPAQESLQREINPVVYNAAEFARRVAGKDSFVANILTHPKLFVIGTEHDLAKLAGHPAPASV